MKHTILMSVMALGLVSCATAKQKFLDASAVSMNHGSVPAGAKLKDVGPVTGSFCMDSFNDKGEFGLMDEAVKDANKKSGAEIITDATFYTQGSCVTVEGHGHTVSR